MWIPVLQYDLKGNFVKEWKSISHVQKEAGILDVSWACKGKHHSAGGFQWRYKDGDIPLKINSARPYRKQVAQLDKHTGDIIRLWDSATEVKKVLGINHVTKVCSGYGSHKTSGGYKWKFID